ncbi:hypothetical protein LNKW23_34870 [Paralimibaculum aggregatum]|uniref:Uncharacterized protein n=1 Tax=Paralimibaculum aggregatum TaxID=3036245 RepID=A0ABQ6LM42_9RHOB|nr:hypothetical protein [Limibaculum sp. NKW23]GMG84272.1 hypothetical protein LNKW23_34870 [Limibaculum sp. NKW23]
MRDAMLRAAAALGIGLGIGLAGWLAAAAPAGAREPWEGTWVIGGGDCAAPGEAVLELTASGMSFHESFCRFAAVAPAGVEGAWAVEAVCEGEGERWTRRLLLLLHGEHWNALTLYEGDFTSYDRCG